MAKLNKNTRYILAFADGSMTDPLLPSEMTKQDRIEAVSIDPVQTEHTRRDYTDSATSNDMRFGA